LLTVLFNNFTRSKRAIYLYRFKSSFATSRRSWRVFGGHHGIRISRVDDDSRRSTSSTLASISSIDHGQRQLLAFEYIRQRRLPSQKPFWNGIITLKLLRKRVSSPSLSVSNFNSGGSWGLNKPLQCCRQKYDTSFAAVGVRHSVEPARWHRRGFRAYWHWKSRRIGGRPRVDAEVRALIRRMNRENPLPPCGLIK
jgi:hypothetical protein